MKKSFCAVTRVSAARSALLPAQMAVRSAIGMRLRAQYGLRFDSLFGRAEAPLGRVQLFNGE